MTNVQQVLPVYQQFKDAFDRNELEKAVQLVAQLKKLLVQLPSFLSITAGLLNDIVLNEETTQEFLVIREVLEHAVILSAKTKDLESFERNVKQVKAYYANQLPGVPKSAREELILGLNLLRLLAQNSIAEFHTELELIPIDLHKKSMYIKHAIQMELFLMEGSYTKLRSLRDKAPAPEYSLFMDLMIDTIRKEIADCTELSYERISLSGLQKLLLFQNEQEARNFSSSRMSWSIENDEVVFEKTAETKKDTSRDIITRTLFYAKDMERIV
ncbi:26S proteasome non-ATPase regulatory subunit Nin1 [Naegleria gruberi]|uniref:26S proteasome non-ATPase regulatory subunit Nin1 n=1 Tax=Naegleria gruberi TaxID=5762 RepID=D2VKU8_NAEGR|nr:26S proteasome non-ATPase regulatory subunit Nin1 [Naegleria gruberi]EFC42432.1 26S proteasome non-ATPase regulatory subunit Nin1 [Naegleria gruberi]|eukprot:XP_002675176.1 26S proteasome non-ATPase regulatory subunit Nin1 [Naegleria gruberi strain NEG-M]